MDIHENVKKGSKIIYIYDEKWSFDNDVDKDWFWFLILMYNENIYRKLIYNIFLNYHEQEIEQEIVKYYLKITYAIHII